MFEDHATNSAKRGKSTVEILHSMNLAIVNFATPCHRNGVNVDRRESDRKRTALNSRDHDGRLSAFDSFGTIPFHRGTIAHPLHRAS
jgi:hypothetical protein